MNKLRLNDLAVESFATTGLNTEPRGTVRGFQLTVDHALCGTGNSIDYHTCQDGCMHTNAPMDTCYRPCSEDCRM